MRRTILLVVLLVSVWVDILYHIGMMEHFGDVWFWFVRLPFLIIFRIEFLILFLVSALVFLGGMTKAKRWERK